MKERLVLDPFTKNHQIFPAAIYDKNTPVGYLSDFYIAITNEKPYCHSLIYGTKSIDSILIDDNFLENIPKDQHGTYIKPSTDHYDLPTITIHTLYGKYCLGTIFPLLKNSIHRDVILPILKKDESKYSRVDEVIENLSFLIKKDHKYLLHKLEKLIEGEDLINLLHRYKIDYQIRNITDLINNKISDIETSCLNRDQKYIFEIQMGENAYSTYGLNRYKAVIANKLIDINEFINEYQYFFDHSQNKPKLIGYSKFGSSYENMRYFTIKFQNNDFFAYFSEELGNLEDSSNPKIFDLNHNKFFQDTKLALFVLDLFKAIENEHVYKVFNKMPIRIFSDINFKTDVLNMMKQDAWFKGDKGLQGERGLPGKDGVSPSTSDVTNKLKSDTTFKDGVVNVLKSDDVFKTSMTEKMKLDSDFQSIIVKAIGTSDEMLKNTLTARDIALKAQDKAELAKYKAIKAKVAAESAQKDAEGEKNFAIKKAGEAQKYYKNVDAMNKNFIDIFCHMEQNKNSKFCTSRKKGQFLQKIKILS